MPIRMAFPWWVGCVVTLLLSSDAASALYMLQETPFTCPSANPLTYASISTPNGYNFYGAASCLLGDTGVVSGQVCNCYCLGTQRLSSFSYAVGTPRSLWESAFTQSACSMATCDAYAMNFQAFGLPCSINQNAVAVQTTGLPLPTPTSFASITGGSQTKGSCAIISNTCTQTMASGDPSIWCNNPSQYGQTYFRQMPCGYNVSSCQSSLIGMTSYTVSVTFCGDDNCNVISITPTSTRSAGLPMRTKVALGLGIPALGFLWSAGWAIGVYRFRSGIVKEAEQLTDYGGPFTPAFYVGETTKVCMYVLLKQTARSLT